MRQVINVKDIMVFFNKKERQSYKMIAEIKKHYNKLPFQPLTINEFANYYNISQDIILEVMQENDQLKTQQIESQKLKLEQDKESKDKADKDKKHQLLEKLEAKEKEIPRFTSKKF